MNKREFLNKLNEILSFILTLFANLFKDKKYSGDTNFYLKMFFFILENLISSTDSIPGKCAISGTFKYAIKIYSMAYLHHNIDV